MQRACLSCGAVNASNAGFCSRCGKPLSSKRVSNPSGTQARHRSENSMLCKRCNKQVRVKGKANYWFEPDSPVELERVEWECIVLECNHKIRVRKTGRTDNDLTRP
jgi:predicted amidophosphoribosyltransferase